MVATQSLVLAVVLVATQVACVVKLIYKLFVVLRSVARSSSWCCGSSLTGAEPKDREIRKEWAKSLAIRRAHCGKVVAFAGLVASSVVNVPVLMDLLTEESLLMSSQNVFLTLVLTIAAFFPKVMDSDVLANVVHLLVIVCMCVMALNAPPNRAMPSYNEMVSTPMLIFCGLATRFSIMVLSNAALMVCQVITSRAAFEERALWLPSRPRHPDPALQSQFTNAAVLLFVTRIYMCWVGDSALKKVTRTEVEAWYDRRQQSAASLLLGMMCDAVFDLDGDLRFDDHCPKFAGMLMHGPGKSLEGQSLMDFVADADDRAKLESELRKGGADDGELPPAGMSTLSLRDSIGNRVKTTLMHVPYRSIDGSKRHLIGMREDTEISRMTVAGDTWTPSAPEAVLRQDLAVRLQEIGMSTSRNLARGSRNATASSRHSSRTGSSSGNASNEEANINRSAEVFFFPSLPVRWIAEDLRTELGLGQPGPDPMDSGVELGQLLPDGGEGLFGAITAIVERQKKRYKTGRFVKTVGDFDFYSSMPSSSSTTDGEAQNPAVESRTVWVNFYVPLREDEGLPYVGVAISRSSPTSGAGSEVQARRNLRGTASSSMAEALPTRARSSEPGPGRLLL